MKKIIAAFRGSVEEAGIIRRLAAEDKTEVVAVALDLGEGPGLMDLHDHACAAGARRCHVLDVREEFARDYLLPAIQAGALGDDTNAAVGRLARAITERKLEEVAGLEGTPDILPLVASVEAAPTAGARAVTLDRAANVQIGFDAGVPVAVNDIPMTLVELIECLSTIASAHGIRSPRPALQMLQSARQELGPDPTGSVHMIVFKGRHEPASLVGAV